MSIGLCSAHDTQSILKPNRSISSFQKPSQAKLHMAPRVTDKLGLQSEQYFTSASDDSTAKIWDASSGECLQTLKGHSSYVSNIG
jgi:WD40 repeat protein